MTPILTSRCPQTSRRDLSTVSATGLLGFHRSCSSHFVAEAHSPTGKLPNDEPAQPTSPPSSTLNSSPQRSSSAPPPPSFQLTAALPYRPLPNPPPAPPAPAPPAHCPAGPFNLTSAAPSIAVPRPVVPLPPPTSGVAGPFSLTRRPALTVSTSVPSLRNRVARSTGALFDFGLGSRSATVNGDEEDAEDDPGRWEKGGAKRPRFDGGFPREWAQQEEG